jgi:hypothetical protein
MPFLLPRSSKYSKLFCNLREEELFGEIGYREGTLDADVDGKRRLDNLRELYTGVAAGDLLSRTPPSFFRPPILLLLLRAGGLALG